MTGNLLLFFIFCFTIHDTFGIEVQNWSGKLHEHDWDYDDNGESGPKNWYKKYSQCGSRQRQSPIEIWPNRMEIAPQCDTKGNHWLQFLNYETTLKDVYLKNNGHSVMLQLEKHDLQLSASFLDSEYALKSLHFHWGPTPHTGSEHKIAHTYYPFEMHLVHYKVGVKEPQEPGDIAVIGVFFRIGNEQNFNQELRKIAKKLNEVEHAEQNSTLDSLTLINLLPQNRDKILRYNGSLTTPPCSEVVDWIIFTDPGFIEIQDLKLFSNLLTNMTKGLSNSRPRQPLNGRKLTFYTNLDNKRSELKSLESETENRPNLLESKSGNRGSVLNSEIQINFISFAFSYLFCYFVL